jgi:branched-chain amino acid transport system substrate-binding protein
VRQADVTHIKHYGNINMLTKTLSAVLLSSALFAPFAALAQQESIKIGFVGDLSGPLSDLAQDQYDALMLLVEKNGGKLGGYPVQVLREDSQLKPEVAVQVTQKLIERDKVDIITGLTFTPTVVAATKVAAANKVFAIGTNGSTNAMAGAECSPYVFITSWQLVPHVEVLAKYAEQKGYKRVSLMAPNFVTGRAFLSIFKEHFSGQIVDEMYTPMTQQDFSAELLQVSASKPDAMFVFYPGGLGVNFVRQYRQTLGDSIPLMAHGALDGYTLSAIGDAALGYITAQIWSPDMDNAANKEFVADFEKKYKRIPSMMGAQAYEAALLLDSAIAKVKGNVKDKDAFHAALKAADFHAVRGNFRFGNNQFPIQDHHVIVIGKDSQGRVVQQLLATPMKDVVDPFAAQCPMK